MECADPVNIPASTLALFWEYPAGTITFERNRDLVMEKVLSRGGWEDVQWLRSVAGDNAILDWLLRTKGRALERAQIRFWQLVLDIPSEEADAWLSIPDREIWDRR